MAYIKAPEGWFTFGTHADMDPVPMLEFSDRKGSDGHPLWERPMVVCTEDICGSRSVAVEPGVSLCLQHCHPTLRTLCRHFREELKEKERPHLEQVQRRRRLDAEARELAEREAGWVAPPDRITFRGTSIRAYDAGLPGHGKKA